jgi:putative lipase involved disintegration of autophagic bodies
MFSYMDELEYFEIDKELSTEEHSIFHDKNTKETIISYRGTTNMKDVITDSQILVSREENTDRYKKSQEIFDRVAEKYGKDNIAVTGHSLGGGVALHIAENK